MFFKKLRKCRNYVKVVFTCLIHHFRDFTFVREHGSYRKTEEEIKVAVFNVVFPDPVDDFL